MDWISVNACCSAASEAIARTSLGLNKFVREVRESRSELDAISTELHSLDGVLGLLSDDAASFPGPLAEQTPGVLDTCVTLIYELEGFVSALNRPSASNIDKKSRWMASRDRASHLRWTLGEYKLALGLAVDLVGVIKSQTSESEQGLSIDKQNTGCGRSNQDSGPAAEAARIIETAGNIRNDLQQNVALAKLGEYLDVLRAQAASAAGRHESQLSGNHRGPSTSVGGGAPDSAIDVGYDEETIALPDMQTQTTPPEQKGLHFEGWGEELDDFAGELNEMPVRAPPVPVRSVSRMSSSTASSTRSPRSTTSDSYRSRGMAGRFNDSRSSGFSASSRFAPHRSVQERCYTPATELSYPMGDFRSPRSSACAQIYNPIWENPRPIVPSRPTTSNSEKPPLHPETGIPRRSSSKFSTTLRSLLHKRSSERPDDERAGVGPDAVFGVPLAKSIQVAKGIASTRHGGGGSSARTARDYPLCVLRCIYYIRDCGLETPHVFGADANQLLLAQLKEIFNSPETGYGKDLDWSRFTVYEAADLILLFLSELPKPLVSESVAKHWISLSKQANVPGTLGLRLDQGIDFWEEAFLGIHSPARELFKLLLNLWADIADASAVNEMTAERLAGRVLRPLMHASVARHQTEFLLGLAFMIRKRSEYNLAARGVGRKRSNAAFQ
ncbi:hypothetical protein VTK56DRAFT_6165 [Thermocarpiscus australiensis]